VSIRTIITRDHPNIHVKAKRVPTVDDSIRRLMDDMVETMLDAPGVGLAATQIDVPLRIFVMKIDNQIYHVANPELIKRRGEVTHDEGCLSVPGWTGETRRSEWVHIKGLNRHGKEIRIKGDGLLAQCIQHEMDHLDGMLYLDRLTSMDSLRELQFVRAPDEHAVTAEVAIEQDGEPAGKASG
jgi:peptide deformylase